MERQPESRDSERESGKETMRGRERRVRESECEMNGIGSLGVK